MNGTELKRRRMAINLTQAELATELGVTETTLARWERDESTPPKKMLNLALHQIEMEAIAPDDLLRQCRELSERIESKYGAERQRVRKSSDEEEMTEAKAKRIHEEMERRWSGGKGR